MTPALSIVRPAFGTTNKSCRSIQRSCLALMTAASSGDNIRDSANANEVRCRTSWGERYGFLSLLFRFLWRQEGRDALPSRRQRGSHRHCLRTSKISKRPPHRTLEWRPPHDAALVSRVDQRRRKPGPTFVNGRSCVFRSTNNRRRPGDVSGRLGFCGCNR